MGIKVCIFSGIVVWCVRACWCVCVLVRVSVLVRLPRGAVPTRELWDSDFLFVPGLCVLLACPLVPGGRAHLGALDIPPGCVA